MADDNMKRRTVARFFHEVIFYHILLCLPADVLYNCMRYVCKSWASIIRDPRFIEEHLREASAGLILSEYDCPDFCSSGRPKLFEIEGGDFKVREMICQSPDRIMCSCDGILLVKVPCTFRINREMDHHQFQNRRVCDCDGLSIFKVPGTIWNYTSSPYTYFVTNPITMEAERVPHHGLNHTRIFSETSLARIPSTRELKLVQRYHVERQVFSWLVLTVGKDSKWREINDPVDHEDMYLKGDPFIIPVSIEGVVYHVDLIAVSKDESSIVAIDMSDETIHKISLPSGFSSPRAFMKMGSHLSYVKINEPGTLFEVSILKDYQKEEWTKLFNVDIENFPGGRSPYRWLYVTPIAWLNKEQTLLLDRKQVEDSYVAYEVKTGEMRIVDALEILRSGAILPGNIHTKSLVSWK